VVDQRSQEVPMFSAIRSSHRSASLITRVTGALPHLPRPQRKRNRRVGAAAIVSAVAALVALLIGIAAVMFRARGRRP
jgi:hypothetical protein